MKTRTLNSYVSVYKEQLQKGDVQAAYAGLVKYLQTLSTIFSKDLSDQYSVGNVFQGYMDYSYFYLSNNYLKGKKLKLGLVLNHAEVRFEFWLLGQTKEVQRKYWDLLKNSKWVNTSCMPKYSILETILVEDPNYDELDLLTDELKKEFCLVAADVEATLEQME